MAAPKGHPRYGGRQKGVPNKLSASVKASLQAVFAARGGDKALEAWANENQTEFYKLWGRLIPQELSGPDGGPVEFAGILREITKPKNPHSNG